MLLTRLIKNVMSRPEAALPEPGEVSSAAPRVLNVGGGNKAIPLPPHYEGWQHVLLDIAPGPDVDVILDARLLTSATPEQFDAIYCSHNLEHYYRHDCTKVLAGFMHVLKPHGHIEIRVPNMTAVLGMAVNRGLDIDDVLYVSPGGPITVHDVIYGWGDQIERSGVDFYAHKRGFTVKSLNAALERAGCKEVVSVVTDGDIEIRAVAFKTEPSPERLAVLGLAPSA